MGGCAAGLPSALEHAVPGSRRANACLVDPRIHASYSDRVTHKIILEEHELAQVVRDHVRVKYSDLTKSKVIEVKIDRVSTDTRSPGQYTATVTITDQPPTPDSR